MMWLIFSTMCQKSSALIETNFSAKGMPTEDVPSTSIDCF